MSRSNTLIVVTCGLLSACAAAPLAEMALSPLRPAASPCAAGAACPPLEDTGTLVAVSHGVSDSLRQIAVQRPYTSPR